MASGASARRGLKSWPWPAHVLLGVLLGALIGIVIGTRIEQFQSDPGTASKQTTIRIELGLSLLPAVFCSFAGGVCALGLVWERGGAWRWVVVGLGVAIRELGPLPPQPC